MSIKCGNCGREFESETKLWEHMIDDHNSPAYDGDAKNICKKIFTKRIQKDANDEKSKAQLVKMEDY